MTNFPEVNKHRMPPMLQRLAVETRYFGPTYTRSSRIRAAVFKTGGTLDRYVWHSWNHELNIKDNERAALRKFITAMGWDEWVNSGVWVSGKLDGNRSVWVYISELDLEDMVKTGR